MAANMASLFGVTADAEHNATRAETVVKNFFSISLFAP
jgi:hypothetical protein